MYVQIKPGLKLLFDLIECIEAERELHGRMTPTPEEWERVCAARRFAHHSVTRELWTTDPPQGESVTDAEMDVLSRGGPRIRKLVQEVRYLRDKVAYHNNQSELAREISNTLERFGLLFPPQSDSDRVTNANARPSLPSEE